MSPRPGHPLTVKAALRSSLHTATRGAAVGIAAAIFATAASTAAAVVAATEGDALGAAAVSRGTCSRDAASGSGGCFRRHHRQRREAGKRDIGRGRGAATIIAAGCVATAFLAATASTATAIVTTAECQALVAATGANTTGSGRRVGRLGFRNVDRRYWMQVVAAAGLLGQATLLFGQTTVRGVLDLGLGHATRPCCGSIERCDFRFALADETRDGHQSRSDERDT